MAEVMPFAGTRYVAKESQLSMADTIAPPFDMITPELQRELHARSELNIVRLVLGNSAPSDDENNNRHTRAAECYRDWKARGVLSDEQRKCFYVYEQEYVPHSGSAPVKMLGFFALVKLQDFRSAKIRSYEETFDSPRADRLKLLRTTQVNESPVNLLYHDSDNEVQDVLQAAMKRLESIEEFKTPDGVVHRLWMMHKKDPILAIHEAMKKRILYIADGHYQYETALKFRDEMREMTGRRDGRQPSDFALMFLQRAESEATYARAVHRVLARELSLDSDVEEVIEDLEDYFTVSEFKVNMKDLAKGEAQVAEKLKPARGVATRMVMAMPSGRAWQLTLRKDIDLNDMIEEETMSPDFKKLDVVLLHSYVITRGWLGNPDMEIGEDDILYREEIGECLDLLQRRKGCVAFFLNPLAKEDLLKVAENGELLPPRSLEFYPKIPSGLVLRDLQVGFG